MRRHRNGFMNIFFLSGLMVLFLLMVVLTEEAGEMRLKRMELERMLAFDYRVESYYLLLHSGAVTLDEDEDEVYGSLTKYSFEDMKSEDQYILIRRMENQTTIKGHFKGEDRGYYEISK